MLHVNTFDKPGPWLVFKIDVLCGEEQGLGKMKHWMH